MASSTNKDGALLTDINVTPLVDVVLVLLVIMMATATAIASRTIPVQLPKASSGTPLEQARPPLAVGIDESGAVFVEHARVTDDELRTRARGVESAIVAADGRARHEAVVHALEVLRSERVAKISIVVRDGR